MLAKTSPISLIIYDSHGVESEFIEVSMKNPKFPKFLVNLAKFYIKTYEKLVCYLSDKIVNVSSLDMNYYNKYYKIDSNKLIQIPIQSSLDPHQFNNKQINRNSARRKLNLPINKKIAIFHGGKRHPSNIEAINLIRGFISSNLKDEDILIVIAGSELEKFEEKNVLCLGYVEKLEDLLNAADIAIVPILSGSGMRVKCADYIYSNLPIVSTEKGVEGLDLLKNNHNCLIYKKINDNYIKGIKKLLYDDTLRKKFRENLEIESQSFKSDKLKKKYLSFLLKI